jgi:carotenoid 1,2-hydratase
VFSPYYRRALRRGRCAGADDHCAINVCLYGPRGKWWTMTERGARHVRRSRHDFAVGPSRVHWDGQALHIDVDERCMPFPRAVRGRITVHPEALSTHRQALDAAGLHHWGPIAPSARIEVALHAPAMRWSGHAYVDSNDGDEPIERGFRRWDWLRAPLDGGSCGVVYDVQPLHGADRLVAVRFGRDGAAAPLEVPVAHGLPAAPLWRIDRRVRSGAAGPPPRVLRTLEDTPFYARSLLRLSLEGREREAVHETLDTARLVQPVVQGMLPFRMPRRT